MASNFIVSYDLMAPGQGYNRVYEAIQSIGPWARIEMSLFHVKSDKSIEQVTAIIWNAMDDNDSLFVVNASKNEFEARNINAEILIHLQDFWTQ